MPWLDVTDSPSDATTGRVTPGIVRGGCWTGKDLNPLYRVYAAAAREAGVSRLVEKDLPGVGISEHPLSDGRMVVK